MPQQNVNISFPTLLFWEYDLLSISLSIIVYEITKVFFQSTENFPNVSKFNICDNAFPCIDNVILRTENLYVKITHSHNIFNYPRSN